MHAKQYNEDALLKARLRRWNNILCAHHNCKFSRLARNHAPNSMAATEEKEEWRTTAAHGYPSDKCHFRPSLYFISVAYLNKHDLDLIIK